ncbi:MAG: AbrB/MazE/SpoVT family DNA-binding domain-containing protein [Deltaproteobacteria bacterium]|nr:AbrB/MazE/SpoVT family DNA-binding domain-containing protein [Deltaproteobacteria bacterium]
MRITSKGQVTIPQRIREQLGFLPGTEVEFVVEGSSLRVVKSPRSPGRGKRIVDNMRGRATKALTTDEILALTRGEE